MSLAIVIIECRQRQAVTSFWRVRASSNHHFCVPLSVAVWIIHFIHIRMMKDLTLFVHLCLDGEKLRLWQDQNKKRVVQGMSLFMSQCLYAICPFFPVFRLRFISFFLSLVPFLYFLIYYLSFFLSFFISFVTDRPICITFFPVFFLSFLSVCLFVCLIWMIKFKPIF